MIPPGIFRAPSTGRWPSQPSLVRPVQVPQASWPSWPRSPGLCDHRAGPFTGSGCLPLHGGAAVNPGAGSVRVCPPPSLSIVLGLSTLKDFILRVAFPQSTGCWLSNSSSQSFTRGLSQAPFPRPGARPGLWSRSHQPSFHSSCRTCFLSPLSCLWLQLPTLSHPGSQPPLSRQWSALSRGRISTPSLSWPHRGFYI